jgi:perosamine synthetase
MIPVSEPSIGEKELEYISDAVKSGWISSEGKYLNAFEANFALYVRRRHGIAVNNGTNALTLALRTLELPAGNEVVIPSFTIISCALACIYNGLIPLFVDSEPGTGNIDAAKIEGKITRKTKAIMPVHIYGHPVDVDAILDIAKKYDLSIIEDFAEAIGSEYKGKRCGGFGDISCVSFYANKTITTGEGGMCLTDDAELASRMRSLRNLGFIPNHRFVHDEPGYNFRMTNIQAAIGLAQLERIEEHVTKKIAIGRRYLKLLRGLEEKGLVTLPVEKSWAKNTYWMFGIVLNKKAGMHAAEAMKRLLEKGVQTRPFFYPMHLQPLFARYPWYKKERLAVSEHLHQNGFYLPSGLTLTEDALGRVASYVEEVLT